MESGNNRIKLLWKSVSIYLFIYLLITAANVASAKLSNTIKIKELDYNVVKKIVDRQHSKVQGKRFQFKVSSFFLQYFYAFLSSHSANLGLRLKHEHDMVKWTISNTFRLKAFTSEHKSI